MYGIPNMKLDKSVIERKIKVMEAEGITFKTGVNVGADVTAEELSEKFDRVILACGASRPRDTCSRHRRRRHRQRLCRFIYPAGGEERRSAGDDAKAARAEGGK